MGASAKTTGGRTKTTAKAPGARKSARGSARSARAEAIRSATPPARPKNRRKPKPRRYDTTTSSRPRILEVARTRAAELGYENLKLSDITDGAEISHQGFYIHFKSKRHAVAVATSDQLGAVASLVSSSSERDEAWAKRLEEEIDNALAEAYPAADGPEGRLRRKLVEVIEANAFGRTRIEELVRAAELSHGEFYRRYGGKKACLQRIYGQALTEVEQSFGRDRSLDALAEALAADPARARLLAVGSSYLPSGPEREPGVSTQESFPGLVARLVASSGNLAPFEVEMISGAALEVIRSIAMAGEIESLARRVGGIDAIRPHRLESVANVIAA